MRSSEVKSVSFIQTDTEDGDDLTRVSPVSGFPPSSCVLLQHYASRSGHLAVCSLLLQSGACASPRTPGGATPLHRSAYCGHLDVVGLLLQHRADPTLCDDDGATPLHKVQT